VLLGTVDLEDLGDYLPGRVLSAVDGTVDDGLSPGLGAAVGLGWVVAIGVLGGVRSARRDVT
jgi:hypothetical protein